MGNLHETVTDSDLGKLFGLRTKSCLIDNSLIEMSKLRGVSCSSLKLIISYFSNRNHRTKIKERFSNRLKIEFGIRQYSILGPLLFDIKSINMFYECEDSGIENNAYNTTPYACASDIDTVISE